MNGESEYLAEMGTHFGKIAWKSMHSVATLLAATCPHCGDAEEAVVFLHDVINVKLGKPIHDRDNYKKWLGIAQTKFAENVTFDAVTDELTKVENLLAKLFMLTDLQANPFILNRISTFTKEISGILMMWKQFVVTMENLPNFQLDVREIEHEQIGSSAD